ncbi:MAG: glycerol-3-phosphate 1-O-acyltransferase PlsY, partial [Candidatus Krumholzibacteria bacterium]|nr:glycerol-3-phosphate 1-O-acyltransferase PlsY [Candidatus Krumholzibacteria bacterium]
EHGSGNLGASNTFRFLGPKIAVLVLVADIAKGFLPTFFAPIYAIGHSLPDRWLMLIAGFFAVIGHMFSVFVGFRGGKGIATTAGVFMALSPVAFLGAFLVWAAVMLTTRIVSVASMSAAIALPAVVYGVGRVGVASADTSLLIISFAITLVVLVKHRSNIRRLVAGKEPVLRRHRPENHAG